ELVGYVRRGEPVGEMALIAGSAHTASAYALRDTELIRIDRADYERLWHAHPVLIQSLARQMLARAREARRDLHAAPPRIFALIGLSRSIDIAARAAELCRRITARGLKCTRLTEADRDKPPTYFEAIEQQSDVVLFEAQAEDEHWYRLVMRQADRIWLFARGDDHPTLPAPVLQDAQSAAQRFRLVDLVCLNQGAAVTPHVQECLKATNAKQLFHWRTDTDADRLARTITGRSVGLVLSGGGARAYAHIGAIKALHEARIPIDFIGGTSMGGIVAAGIAMGWNDDELDAHIRDAFVTSNPLGDHHLPVVALTRGHLVEQRLAKHFGDARIEDLHLPYYCVSSDLVSATQYVHRSGLLREALRASIALPGILPPVATNEHVLVDGAVLNNLPTDVMQTLHHGITIGIDVAERGSIDPKDFINPPDFAQWVMKHGFKEPPPIVSLLIRAATIGIDPTAHRKDADLIVTPELGNVELRDWHAYDQAVRAGYEGMVRALASPEGAELPRVG
ncbi:MAG: patatin-like phospholipase family protein, partial [Alphaproteobacteria bacterium]